MRYTYIKLVDYKRFPLMESNVFERVFDTKLIMITGANGAGKSSLISELSPLPADKNDFYKGGYKEVHIEKDGSVFKLISDYTTGTKYSFIRDEEELNPSGNVSTQKELAAIHFNITPLIHEVLTGGESFTDMGLLSRKKLFNSITHLNIDGIVANYESLKEELKNNEYLIKTLSSRLMAEKDKLLNEPKSIAIAMRVKEIRSHIETLLAIRTEIHHLRNAQDLGTTGQSMKSLKETLRVLYRNNSVLLSAYPLRQLNTISDSCKEDEGRLSNRLKSLYVTMEHLLYEKKSLELTKVSDLRTVSEQIASLESTITVIESRLDILPKDTGRLDAVINDLNLLERSLPDILEKLPPNEDKRLSKSNHTSLIEQRSTKVLSLNTLLREDSSLQAELRELETHKSLNCPNCEHVWLPQEVSSRITKVTTRLKEVVISRVALEEEVRVLSGSIETQETYLGNLALFMNLYTATKPNLKPIWDYIATKSLLYVSPSSIMQVVCNAISECNALLQCSEYRNRIVQMKQQKELLEVSKTTSFETNLKETAMTESAISETMDEMARLKENLNDCAHARRVYDSISKTSEAITLAKQKIHASTTKHTVDAVLTEIDQQLSMSKIEVIELEKELGKNSAVQASIDILLEQIVEAEQNKKVLTILTDELSPKTGLIAKTISNFLNVIIRSINTVVSSVWDYRMELKPIDLGTDQLNYRFKVEVGDRLMVDDISKVSSGMKEIINLAMKITMYKLLKLDGYPMKLDEFGVKLDAVHRGKVASIIFKMLNSPQFSQIFLITHLDLAYSNFKDTTVLEF